MIVDIGKIIIKDRIRKDFGDIQELADDIKQNGLINPPVVNKDYELLAGERRLRACKSLGWAQIEVRMMDTRDKKHDFDVEVSENENRKDFSRTEREAVYTKYVELKLQESGPNGPRVKPLEHEAAKLLGTSRTNMNREKEIIKNKDLLSPEDFAEWDEGKLSTNKVFQKVKARQKEIETENEKLRQQISESETKSVLERKRLEQEIEKAKEKNTVVKEVIKKVEVVPEDYTDLQLRAKYADSYEKDYLTIKKEYDKMQGKLSETEKENQSLKERIEAPDFEKVENRKRSALFFAAGTKDFIERFGGYVWLTNEVSDMDENEREDFLWSVQALEGFVFRMKENLSDVGKK